MRKILMLLMLMVGLVVHASTTDYNVRDFGAKGDGKTLDHHAINAAIDSCVAHGGNIGTGDKAIAFKLCRNILIRDVTIYRGGHFGIILTGCELGTVDNVTIDTNRDGFDIDCCKYLTVSNCKINTTQGNLMISRSLFGIILQKQIWQNQMEIKVLNE